MLSINQALGLWPRYCNIFLACLSHDASSVRQTTSLLFAHLGTAKIKDCCCYKIYWTALLFCISFLTQMFLFIINFGWSVNEVEYMACNLYVKKIIFKYDQWDRINSIWGSTSTVILLYNGLPAQLFYNTKANIIHELLFVFILLFW